MLQLITPATPIITAARAKARQPALADAAEPVIDHEIAVATAQVERFIGRALGAQTWEYRPSTCYFGTLDSLWGTALWGTTATLRSCFHLPLPPLQSVTSIKYLDSDGDEQTFDAANYLVSGVNADNAYGRVSLKGSAAWPTVGDYPEAVRIRFVAGYATVPLPLVQAVILLAANSFTTGSTGGNGTVRRETIEGVGSIDYYASSSSSSSTSADALTTGAVAALMQPFRMFR